MLFLTTLDIIPGKAEEMFYLIRKVEPPPTIKVREFLKLFGKPDFAIIYEAPSEEEAVNFILKYASCSTPKTSLCQPVEKYAKQED
jgi:uncharacterized protein with GYD domain